MKKVFYLLICQLLSVSYLFADGVQTENRTVIFTPSGGEKVHLLTPGSSVSETVSFKQEAYSVRRLLRVVGGVKMPAPFEKRGEEMFRRSEFYIDDNLDSVHVKKDKYSLYFKGEDNNFERHAYYRIPGDLLKPGELTVTFCGW